MQTFNATDFFPRAVGKDWSETPLFKILENLPPVSTEGPWLGGGAIRRTIMGASPDSDFDFFFTGEDQFSLFTVALAGKGYKLKRETEHHQQWEGYCEVAERVIEVQCIRFQYYGSKAQVLDSFDFTICQFVYDGTEIAASDYALWDLGRKRLAINKITYPLSSMRRLLKYARQGFTACDGCLSTLATAIADNPALADTMHVKYVD